MARRIRWRIAALLLGGLHLVQPSAASENNPPSATNTESRLTRLALDIHRYRHESGLSVVLNPDRSSVTVAVCMSFPNQARTLAREDRFAARLLQLARDENLNVPAEVARQSAWRGISQRSALAWDLVSFSRTIPAYDLEFGIWAMARQSQHGSLRALPRLGHDWSPQAPGVRSAARARVLDWLRAEPAFDLEEGASLESVPLDRVRALAKDFWRSAGAVLALTGDFETEQARAFVDRHFGSPAKADGAATRSAESAPAPIAKRRGELRWPLASVFIGFGIPGVDHADHAPLRILKQVLVTSGLPDTARGARQHAELSAWTAGEAGSDLFVVRVPISRAAQAASAERLLLSWLGKMANASPNADQMSRALERERSEFWQRLENVESRVMMFSEAESRRGDARLALRDLSHTERVRPEDVARVAREYLANQKPALLVAMPGGEP